MKKHLYIKGVNKFMTSQPPKTVLKTMEALKSKHKHAVSVAVIRGSYYALETLKRFDEERKRYITVTHYLGRILDGGTFVPARHRKEETNADSVETLVERREEKAEKIKTGLDVSKLELKILMSLSMDAKKPIVGLAGELGISTSNANYWIRKLEEKYMIRYTIESLTSVFGFTRFAVTIKFTDKKPDFNSVRKVLEKNPFVHLALITKGEYDLFFIILAENNRDLEYQLYDLRKDSIFAAYKAIWNVSALLVTYGYLPLRQQFFDILQKKVWHKSKEAPLKLPDQLLEREYIVLKELSKDGRIDLSSIDDKFGFAPGSAQYTYHKLVEKGIIKRVTITMSTPPIRYLSILHLDQIDMRHFTRTRKKLFLDRIGRVTAPLNKYILTGDYSSPYGILAVVPVFAGSLETLESNLTSKVGGIKIRSLVVTSILVGELGFRLFDNHDSDAYTTLRNTYNYSENELSRIIES